MSEPTKRPAFLRINYPRFIPNLARAIQIRTVLTPHSQPMMLRSLTIRRDETGADVEQARLKMGANVLASLSLRKNEGMIMSIDMVIPANETLTLESDAVVYVDNVNLTEVTRGTLDVLHMWTSGAAGGASFAPVFEVAPKPDPAETITEGRMKAFVKDFKKEKT